MCCLSQLKIAPAKKSPSANFLRKDLHSQGTGGKFQQQIKKAIIILYPASQIVRQGVYTDMNVVPILPLKKYDSSGCVRRLNSFALDFYKHGSSEAIVNENG